MTRLRLHHAPPTDDTPESLKFPDCMRESRRPESDALDSIEAVEEALRRVEGHMEALKTAADDVFHLPGPGNWPPTAA